MGNEGFLNRVLHGDVLYNLKLLNSGSCDLVIADPPYYKVVNNKWDNQWGNDLDYLQWCKEWITECVRVLRPSGSIYIWGGFGEKNGIVFARLLTMLADEFSDDLTIKNIITVKRTKGRGTKYNYMPLREDLVFLVKDKKSYTFHKQYTTEKKNGYGYKRNKDKPPYKVAGNVWSDIVFPWFGSKEEKYINTAQKPLLACKRIINASSNEGETILIPFVGSGSECVASIETNRNWIGIEKDWDNCMIANERIKETQIQSQLKE